MPSGILIGIHGLGKKPRELSYAACWQSAIRDGLVRNFAFAPAQVPLRLIYWGLWNHADNLPDEPYQADAGSGRYPSYVDRWQDLVLTDALAAGGGTVDTAKRFLGLDLAGEDFLRAQLDDLAVYYEDTNQRAKLRGLLRIALQQSAGSRIMLLAHSMGTIVAYDVMRELGRERPDLRVDHLVTLGSPLGLPHVLHRIRSEWGQPRVPTVVRRWSNFAERRDPVAFDAHLSDDFAPSDRGVAVEDAFIINSYGGSGIWRHHSALGYLRAPEVSRLVRDFL